MCMTWRFHFPLRNYDFKSQIVLIVSLITVIILNKVTVSLDRYLAAYRGISMQILFLFLPVTAITQSVRLIAGGGGG